MRRLLAVAIVPLLVACGSGAAPGERTEKAVPSGTQSQMATPLASPMAAPTIAPTPEPQTVQPSVTTSTSIFFLSPGGIPGPVPRGGTALIIVETAPNAHCSIVYIDPSGRISTAPGLEAQTVPATGGLLQWSWPISQDSEPGTGTARVTCNGSTATKTIPIG